MKKKKSKCKRKVLIIIRYQKLDFNTHKEINERVVVEAICIFKDDILPIWEDPKNKNGG
jgi:hypothetical protein